MSCNITLKYPDGKTKELDSFNCGGYPLDEKVAFFEKLAKCDEGEINGIVITDIGNIKTELGAVYLGLSKVIPNYVSSLTYLNEAPDNVVVVVGI